MSLLNDFKALMPSALSLPVFLGAQPTASDDCITLYEDMFSRTDHYLGMAHTISYPKIRVLIRAKTLEMVQRNIQILTSQFSYIATEKFDIILDGDAVGMGRDDKSRTEYIINYKIIKKE